MLRIALGTLRARKGGTAGAFAAVALAVVLVVSCCILLESSLQAPIPVQRLAAAGVVVQASPTFSGTGNVSVPLQERPRLAASLAGRLRPLPGVRSAIADRSFFTQLTDGRGRILTGAGSTVGHGWASAALGPFVLTSGRAPHGPGEIAVGPELGVHVGDQLVVLTARTRRPFTVTGIATGPRTSRESPVFFADAVAARLAGTSGRADLIGLVLAPGTDAKATAGRVRDALGQSRLRVLTGSARGEAESPEDALGREDIVAGLTIFAGLAAFIAIFVVASTFALSVQQRHRELALFRAIGCTPRQVRRMVAGEALLVSLGAFAVAAPLSVVAARLEQRLFTRASMLPDNLHIVNGWLPFAAGLAAAIVTTQLAAFASARRASRIRPTDALREASVQRRPVSWLRGLAGLAAVAGGAAVLLTADGGPESTAPAAALVWMLAAALLGPLLAWPFAWLLGLPLAAISRGPGMLARANTRANLRRVASIAIPVVLAVSLVCTIFFGKTILQRQTERQTSERMRSELVLRADDGSGLPPATAAAARRVPGVAHASGSFATTVVVAADGVNVGSYPARAVDPRTLGQVLDIGVASGSLARLNRQSLAVSTDAARVFGWHLGDRVRLWLGDGTPARLRVAATYTRPLGFGDVLLTQSLVERHVTRPLDEAVFVKAEPGAGTPAVAAALARLRGANPRLDVVTTAQYRAALNAAEREQSLAIYVLLALISGFCALALLNAVTMSTAERAREFALLRLVGAGKRQVRAMVRAESLITVTFGLALGTLIALPGLAVLSRNVTGSSVPDVPLWMYGALVAFFAAVVFAAGVLPTRLALRLDPVRAMAARE